MSLARARLQHPQLALLDGELDVGVIQVIGTTAAIMLDKLLHSLDALEILLVRMMDGPCDATHSPSTPANRKR